MVLQFYQDDPIFSIHFHQNQYQLMMIHYSDSFYKFVYFYLFY